MRYKIYYIYHDCIMPSVLDKEPIYTLDRVKKSMLIAKLENLKSVNGQGIILMNRDIIAIPETSVYFNLDCIAKGGGVLEKNKGFDEKNRVLLPVFNQIKSIVSGGGKGTWLRGY